jgi:hypothetical protein
MVIDCRQSTKIKPFNVFMEDTRDSAPGFQKFRLLEKEHFFNNDKHKYTKFQDIIGPCIGSTGKIRKETAEKPLLREGVLDGYTK